MDFKLERYKTEYKNQLAKLFKDVYKREIDATYFDWRFLNNPINKNLTLIAFEQGQLIGFGSLTPYEAMLNRKKKIFAFSGTSMIHPSRQCRGIYSWMIKKLYKIGFEEGVDLILGFPNSNSHYGRKTKLNWKDIYEIPTYSLKLDEKNSKNLHTDCSIEIDSISNFDFGNIDNILESSHFGKIYLIHDKVYYKWRLLEHPFNKYFYCLFCSSAGKIEGLIFFKYFTNFEVDLLETKILNIKQEAFNAYFTLFINFISQKNVKRINTWINRNNIVHDYFEYFGFNNKFPITYFSYLSKGINQTIENYNNWNISMIDSDVY